MNWENVDSSPEEEAKGLDAIKTQPSNSSIHQQNETKKLVQLKKLLNHKNDEHRREYIAIITKFGELLVNDNKGEIVDTLLTEDCETFLINFAELSPLQHAKKNGEFPGVFQGYRVIQREVKVTYVDLEKATAFQICDCKIRKETEDAMIMQFSFEVFTFRNMKIIKYRASFGCMTATNGSENLFIPSKKEKMIAKVKEINYAWVGQPNLDKLTSLMNERTEYKIYRWKDKKCFTFYKQNFASEFRKSLEEDFEIKSIVPFDPVCEAQYIVGSYVYYLEGKGNLAGKKYQWMSNCIYAFDNNLNIIKISQQGELHPEDEVLIPFEVHSKEKIREQINAFHVNIKESDFSLFSGDKFNFSFDVALFGSSDAYFTGVIKGFNEYKKLTEISALKTGDFELAKLNVFLDLDDLCYDTAIVIDCMKRFIDKEVIHIYGIKTLSFENGKVAKMISFFFGIPGTSPSSLFDDTI